MLHSSIDSLCDDSHIYFRKVVLFFLITIIFFASSIQHTFATDVTIADCTSIVIANSDNPGALPNGAQPMATLGAVSTPGVQCEVEADANGGPALALLPLQTALGFASILGSANFIIDSQTMGTNGLIVSLAPIVLGTFADSLVFSGPGSVAGVDVGAGNDTIDVNWTSGITTALVTATATLNAGDGDDNGLFRNVVVLGGVLGGLGNDTFSIDGTLSNIDTIDAGIGNDQLSLLNGTVGTIFGGTGNDTMTMTGGSVTGAIDAGADDDAFVWSGGTIVSFTGNIGSDTALVTSPSYDGSQILDGGDDVDTADTWIDVLTLQGMTVTVPGANIPNWEHAIVDGGTVTISDGALTVGSGAGLGLTITNGGTVDAGTALAVTGNLTTSAGGTLDATGGGAGVFTISGDVINNGTLTTQDAAVGDTMTIGGNYMGTGALTIDTVLGDSTSSTDQLIVTGDTSGTTTLNITNSGGTGALTGTGSTDGILVVRVTGISSPDAFALAAPLIIGNFTYTLVQADGQNWYLQSTESVTETTTVTNVVCSGSIGNTIWHDINRNGRQDDNEPGLEDIRVKLVDEDGDETRTDTNHNGHYLFEDLPEGRYKVHVKEEDVTDFILTYDPTGKKNHRASVDLDCNDDHTKADFGYAEPESPHVSGPTLAATGYDAIPLLLFFAALGMLGVGLYFYTLQTYGTKNTAQKRKESFYL